MNAQQKLLKRDGELDKIQHQCDEMMEYYSQEKSKTLVEIDKNLEKQEENRGQELVDAEGKQVDIMDDLIRLEGEMHQYIKDIDQIQEEIGTLLHFQQ